MSKLFQITLFTIIEGIAFAGGIYLWLGVSPVAGTIWWLVWTEVEHVTAYNVGAGRPFFSLP